MLNIGAVRPGFNKVITLVANNTKKEGILNSLANNGLKFDDFQDISGKTVNSFLEQVGKTIGKGFEKVSAGDTFEYLNAHGATQIINKESGKEVFCFVEKVQHPIKEYLMSLVKAIKK